MKKTNSIINAVNQTKADLPKKARKPYTKRVKAVSVVDLAIAREYVEGLEAKLDEKSRRLNAIELSLIEKEKEVWTLECEVFDKKAVIKYLEEKLFGMGVRI